MGGSSGRRDRAADPDESPPYPERDKTARVESVVYDIVQILGSLLVLTAFVLTTLHRLRPGAPLALVLNAAGSGVLTVTAVVGREWGFLLLEGVWAVVSLVTLVRVVSRRPRSSRAAVPSLT